MNLTETLKRLGKEEVISQIREAQIHEFGTLNENLADKIERICSMHLPEDGPMIAAAGLNNNDYSGMLLKIVREDSKSVLVGLGTIAWLTDAERVLVYLPAEETELAKQVAADAQELELNVEVVNDIVNARLMRDGITCHVETMKAVSDLLGAMYQPETLVSAVKYETSDSVQTVAEPKYVPFGTALVDVTGSLEGVKAVQVGDVLYLPAEAAGVVITRELALGDGVIKLYAEGCCMLDTTCDQLMASRQKSCGKCTFCREGLIQLYTRMKEIISGKGDAASPQIMAEIGEVMSFSCSCTLGNSGSALTLETLNKFQNEYQDHISKHKCTSHSCLAFVNMYIDPQKCTGCGACVPVCPDDLVEGLPGYIHMIEDIDCTKCGKCMEVCPEGAVVRTEARVPRIPDRLTRVGRFKRY